MPAACPAITTEAEDGSDDRNHKKGDGQMQHVLATVKEY
jgi:hypothetical protein